MLCMYAVLHHKLRHMAANFWFPTCKHSGDVLVIDQYIYHKDRLVNTKRYWKCKTAN